MQDHTGRIRDDWQRFGDDWKAFQTCTEPSDKWVFIPWILAWVARVFDADVVELPWIDCVWPTLLWGTPIAGALLWGRKAARKGPWETSRQAGITAGRTIAIVCFLCGAALLGLGLLVWALGEWLGVSLLNPHSRLLQEQTDTLLPVIGLIVGVPWAMGYLTYLGALTVAARSDPEAPSSQ